MRLPPGPAYILGLLPYFAKPSLIAYFGLKLFQKNLGLELHQWTVVILALLALPALFFCGEYYTTWTNKRAAAKVDAVLAPIIPESPLHLIYEFADFILNGYPGELMLKWAQSYGNTVQFTFLNSTILSTIEPGHVKAALATQFESFDKGQILISQLDSLLGTGVFNADGELWKFHRGITRPFFTRERISDFDLYARNCDVSLKAAKERLLEGYSIDFQDLISRFTLDSSTEFLFGGSVGSLFGPIPYPPSDSKKNPPEFYNHSSIKLVKALTEAMAYTAVRVVRGNQWPLMEFWKDQVAPHRKIINDVTAPLVQAALNNWEKESQGNPESKDGEETTLLANLVKKTQDPKILQDELLNLLIAGRDTTMCLLTFSIYMLAEHPHLEAHLREEINANIGPDGNPTYDQIRELRYMRAFLNEVLRLYPPVPINFRENTKPVILPPGQPDEKPIYVPANTTFLYSVINIHRRTDLWGPDAHNFDPDRFLDERLQKYYIPNPYIFCPFNAGPRICLGQQLAYNEAAFYFVRLLQQFTGFALDMSANTPVPEHWASNKFDIKYKEKIHPMSHLTMYVKGGLWVRMKEVSKSPVA